MNATLGVPEPGSYSLFLLAGRKGQGRPRVSCAVRTALHRPRNLRGSPPVTSEDWRSAFFRLFFSFCAPFLPLGVWDEFPQLSPLPHPVFSSATHSSTGPAVPPRRRLPTIFLRTPDCRSARRPAETPPSPVRYGDVCRAATRWPMIPGPTPRTSTSRMDEGLRRTNSGPVLPDFFPPSFRACPPQVISPCGARLLSAAQRVSLRALRRGDSGSSAKHGAPTRGTMLHRLPDRGSAGAVVSSPRPLPTRTGPPRPPYTSPGQSGR